MTTDERNELLKDLNSTAYVHLNFSGLWRELSNEERERVADEHAEKMLELLERLVDERFTQIEERKSELCGTNY